MDTNRLASRAIEAVTGTKFCYQCAAWRPQAGGSIVRDAKGKERFCCEKHTLIRAEAMAARRAEAVR